jgi:valyl-tRNA synthetase
LSPQNQKISKSQGNNPLEPATLLANYSADVIRYWTASSTLGTDTAFSDTQLKIGNKLCVKLWNAFQFVTEHADAAGILDTGLPASPLNRWILTRLSQAYYEYQRYFEQQEFSLAMAAAERFFWHDVCDNYLELMKDQVFNPHNYTPEECAQTKRTLARVMYHILQLFAPVLAHLTDELYQLQARSVVGALSIHMTTYEALAALPHDDAAVACMQEVLAIVTAVRKAKSEAQRSLKTEIAQLVIVSPVHEELLARLESVDQVIRGVTKATRIAYTAHTDHVAGLHESEAGVIVVVHHTPDTTSVVRES